MDETEINYLKLISGSKERYKNLDLGFFCGGETEFIKITNSVGMPGHFEDRDDGRIFVHD